MDWPLGDPSWEMALMALALARVLCEFLLPFHQKLPLTQKLGQRAQRLHRFGLFMAVGHLILGLSHWAWAL